MSVTQRSEQRSKDSLKPKQKVCQKRKHETKEDAKRAIEAQKNKGLRGTARLHVYRCKTCSSRSKDIFHTGHRKGVY